MVKNNVAADTAAPGERGAGFPCRMAPSLEGRVFRRRVGRVVDEEVGAFDQAENVGVDFAFDMFGIGDIANRPVAPLDPVAGRAVGVVERRGKNGNALAQVEPVAGAKFLEADVRADSLQRHREDRRLNQAEKHVAQADIVVPQVTGMDAQPVAGLEQRDEKGHPRDVVDMGMGQQNVGIDEPRSVQLGPQSAQAGACIQNEQVARAADFEAGRVSSVAGVLRAGTGDRSADAAEADEEIFAARGACCAHRCMRSLAGQRRFRQTNGPPLRGQAGIRPAPSPEFRLGPDSFRFSGATGTRGSPAYGW